MNEAFTTGSWGLRCNAPPLQETRTMTPDPQTPISPNAPRGAGPADGAARPAGPDAPRFPGDALRDWLNHRVRLGVPVWAVIVMSLVLLVVALD
jgi:hypothetical protein